MRFNYDDIIDMPRPQFTKHEKMPSIDRAAQFAPFAALNGYEEAIEETARHTEERIELSEEQQLSLGESLSYLINNIDTQVKITYFVPDTKKQGGEYLTKTTKISKIDEYRRLITLETGEKVPFIDLFSLDFKKN